MQEVRYEEDDVCVSVCEQIDYKNCIYVHTQGHPLGGATCAVAPGPGPVLAKDGHVHTCIHTLHLHLVI